jgi:hypothetical protein
MTIDHLKSNTDARARSPEDASLMVSLWSRLSALHETAAPLLLAP